MWINIKGWFEKAVLIVLASFLVYITYYSFRLPSSFNVDNAINPVKFYDEYLRNVPLILFIGMFLLCCLIFFVFRKITELSYRNLKILIVCLIILILFVELVFLCNFNTIPITDNHMLNDQALVLAKKQSKYIDTNIPYFSKYGNNYFYTILLSFIFKLFLLLGIANFSMALMVLNTLFINIGILFSVLIIKRIFSLHCACKLLFVFSISPALYFSIPWYYTATASIPFFMGIIYLVLLIKDEKKTIYKVIESFLLSFFIIVGFNIRPTAVISLLAIIICYILACLVKKREIKRDIFVIILLTAFSVVFSFSTKILVKNYVENVSNNFPVTHWIMMGLHENGSFLQEDEIYTNSFKTKEEKIEANKKEIVRTLQEYGLTGIIEHIGEKLRVTWTDGTFGYNSRMVEDKKFSKLYKYVVYEKSDFIVLYCQIFHLFLLSAAVVGIINQLKHSSNNSMFVIYLSLLGAIVFYILWEGKNAYSLPFLPLLFMMAFQGIDSIKFEYADIKGENTIFLRALRVVFAITIILTTSTMIVQYPNYVVEKNKFKDKSVYSFNEVFMRYTDQKESRKLNISQEFFSEKPFNTIRIKAKKINPKDQSDKYKATLTQSGNMVFTKYIKSSDINSKEYITLKVPKIKVRSKERFVLQIKCIGKKENIKWGYRYSRQMENIEGDLSINGETQPSDLFIQVYRKYEAPYTTPNRYLFICVAIVLFEFFIYVSIKKTLFKRL